MNTTLKKIVLIAALACPFTLPAQTPQKIGTVDLRKLFDNYYKTKKADADLKDEAAEMQKQSNEMIAKFRKDEGEYQKALERANDQAVSADSREKNKKEAEKLLTDLKEREQAIRTFEQTARTALAEKQRRLRDKVLVEIREVINQKSKAAGFTVVYDTAADSYNQTPVILYSMGDNDITDQVLSVLNEKAPPGFDKPEEPKAVKK